MRFSIRIVVVALAIVVSLPAFGFWAALSAVAPGKGPYSVGATFLLELDPTRTHVDGSARPVPLVVLYPVYPGDAVGAPTARYPRNPFANQASQVFLSTNFEARGLDAAYQGVNPSTAGPFPLIVLSNGARAPYWVSLGIALRVASHGFVVVLMGHYGEAAYANPAPSDPLMHVAQRGLDRILDMKFVIDQMLLRNTQPGDLFHGLIQADQIAVGGHSFGGLTAVQLTGGDDSVCDTYNQTNPPAGTCDAFDEIDTRVKATLLLDASTQNMRYHELARITTGNIMIGQDVGSIERAIQIGEAAPSFPIVWHARAHHAYGGKPNYRVDVINSAHNASFTNICQATLVRGDIGLLTQAQVEAQFTSLHCNDPAYTPYQAANEVTWRYAVAFLTAELVGDTTYKGMLTPGWGVSREPYAMFFVTERLNGQTPDTEFPDESWFHFSQPDSAGMQNHPDMFDEPVLLDWP